MRLIITIAFLLLITVNPAQAYIGPGAGLGAVVVTLSLIVGTALLLVGFLWYPMKRLVRGRKSQRSKHVADNDSAS